MKRPDRRQLTFDVDAQPSLFGDDERAMLVEIEAQGTDADRDALIELRRWARAET